MGSLNIIVAFSSRNFAIGSNNKIPWNIPEDLKYFSNITKDATVVMGRKTWDSIPDDKKPLKGRRNVIVTTLPPSEFPSSPRINIVHPQYINFLCDAWKTAEDVFIIGGASLYETFMGKASRIYATVIDKDFKDCDVFFPVTKFGEYVIESYSDLHHSDIEDCTYRHITYLKSNRGFENESQYLSLMKNILENGKDRPDRTGVSTKSLFATAMVFDISKTIPFLTTKQLMWKSVIKELLWFLSGSSDSKKLESQGVKIWKDNTTRDFLDKRGLSEYREGDCGAMYSHNWRHFSAPYISCDTDYKGQGIDQIGNLIEEIKKDKYSRRHIMTSYDPSSVNKAVLYPCHGIAIQFYVEDDNLDCAVYNRSQDFFLGVPFNVASYAVFCHIIGKYTNLSPRNMTFFMGDTHIYRNHLEQVKEQLSRNPLPGPILVIDDCIKEMKLEDIKLDHFQVIGYLHHSKIAAPMAI